VINSERIGDDHDWRSSIRLIIHPGAPEQVSLFFENFLVKAENIDRVNFQELPSGGIITINADHANRIEAGGLNIPNGSMWRKSEIRFWPTRRPLNELGTVRLTYQIGPDISLSA